MIMCELLIFGTKFSGIYLAKGAKHLFYRLSFVNMQRAKDSTHMFDAKYRYVFVIYEVRDLFPWEMFNKMVISCLLNVEKVWNPAQIKLSSTLNFYRRYVFDATISTEKSTSEIDADLAQNDM